MRYLDFSKYGFSVPFFVERGESMIPLICYFFPAVVATGITEKLEKKDFKGKDILYCFSIYTILINYFIFFVIRVFFQPESLVLLDTDFSYSFTIKYLSIALVFAICFPMIYHFMKKNFQFSIEIIDSEKEEKNEKKRAKKKTPKK